MLREIERLLRLLVAQGQETETLMRILVALAQENNTLTLAQLNETRILESRVRSIEHDVRSIKHNVLDIEQYVKRIVDILTPDIEDFSLTQLQGDVPMAINGVQVGASGTFQIGFVPPNGAPLQSGPTVSVDDALVVLSAVDGSNQFTAAVDATDTAATFNVTVSGVNGAGVALQAVFSVPILAAPPPQITDFTLDQIS